MWFVQPKVILLFILLSEYLKLLINTEAKPVSLVTSLVFVQGRNLPSPSPTEISWALQEQQQFLWSVSREFKVLHNDTTLQYLYPE